MKRAWIRRGLAIAAAGIVASVTVGLASRSWSQGGDGPVERYRREILTGVAAVQVQVEKIRENAENDGLKRDDLCKEVEDRLKKAGIRVLIANERLRFPNTPVLHVYVTTIKVKDQGYAYFVETRLKETVQVVRRRLSRPQPKVIIDAETWHSTSGIGTTSVANLAKDVRAKVIAEVDEFLATQKLGNPREPIVE